MLIRYFIFLIIVVIAVVAWLCLYRRDEFYFHNDRDSWVKKIFLRAKGGFMELKKSEDFSYDVALVIMLVLIGLILLK